MLVTKSKTGVGNQVAKVLYLGSSKHTFLQVDGEALEAAKIEDTAEILLMRFHKVGENQDIIKIDETKWKLTKDLVHHPLESLGGVPEAKGKTGNSKRPKGWMLAFLGMLVGLMGI